MAVKKYIKADIKHCVESVQTRSSFWLVFSCIRTERSESLLALSSFTGFFYPAPSILSGIVAWDNQFIADTKIYFIC